MDVAHQNGCVVYGTLGFVLRLSQIYGVASLRFESVPNGWRVHTSWVASLYGKIVILLMCITTITSVTWDFGLDNEYALHSHRHADTMLTVLTVSVTGTVLLAEAVSGVNRMHQTISCLAQIQKINADLVRYGSHTSFEQLQLVLAVWTLIGGHIIIIIDYAIYFYEIKMRDGDYLMEGIYVAYFAELIMIKILILQICLIITTVLSSFIHLNGCLTKLLRQIRYESPTDGPSNTPSATVHRLAILYCSLRDVVHRLNDSQGLLMVPLATTFIVQFIITPYNCISRISGNNADIYKAISQSWWTIYHVVDLIIFIEPCQRTYCQVNRTKHLISQLMRFTPPSHHTLNAELEIFYKCLIAKEVVYMPLKMLTLNRTLIATILGSITTYLVIMIQL